MRAAYDVVSRARALGRPHYAEPGLEAFAGMLLPEIGERAEPVVGVVDGTTVAYGVGYFPLLDNTDKSWIEGFVDPDHQRQGHGRALLDHLLAQARADGRREIVAETKVPTGEVLTHGYSRFLTDAGFDYANVEIVRTLALPVADEQVQEWAAQAAQRHEGYRIEVFVDEIPDHLVPSLCVLLGQLAVDAPTGEVDWEEEQISPERFRESEEHQRQMGRIRLEALALTPDDQVAAQSTLSVATRDDLPVIWQWGTFVHREHRGHRLGLAVKAANLREVQQRFPDKVRITTQNAESNDFMVSINELMGFEPVEASAEFVFRTHT